MISSVFECPARADTLGPCGSCPWPGRLSSCLRTVPGEPSPCSYEPHSYVVRSVGQVRACRGCHGAHHPLWDSSTLSHAFPINHSVSRAEMLHHPIFLPAQHLASQRKTIWGANRSVIVSRDRLLNPKHQTTKAPIHEEPIDNCVGTVLAQGNLEIEKQTSS